MIFKVALRSSHVFITSPQSWCQPSAVLLTATPVILRFTSLHTVLDCVIFSAVWSGLDAQSHSAGVRI